MILTDGVAAAHEPLQPTSSRACRTARREPRLAAPAPRRRRGRHPPRRRVERGARRARGGARLRHRRAGASCLGRRPIVVAVPTTPDAERLAPTSPLARCGEPDRPRSSCSRRGRRCPSSGSARASRPWAGGCARMWRLRRPRAARRAGCPTWSWRPVRGPGPAPRPPRRRRRAGRGPPAATSSTRPSSWPASSAPATAASTRSSTAARWPCAARSSTCSRRPPTCRCASTCGATRSTGSPSSPSPTSARPPTSTEVEIFGCRELLPTDEVRERAAALVGDRAVGPRAVGAAGRGPGLRRHGVVAAVADRRTSDVLLDLLGAEAQVLLVEPRRMRDRAAELARRGGRPGRHPGRRRGARPAQRRSRSCTCRSTGCSPHTDAPVWTVTAAPEGPDTAAVPAAGWDPVVGDGEQLVSQLARPARRAATGSWCAPRAGARPTGMRRLARATRAWSSPTRPTPTRPPTSSRPGVRLVVAPARAGVHRCPPSSWPCWPRPTSPAGAAPTAGPGPAARRRRGVLRRPQAGRLRRAPPARRGPLRRHGQARRSAGSSATTCCSSTAAATSSTCRPTRSTPCATTPAASARRSAGWAAASGSKTKARVRAAVRRDRPGAGRALPDAASHARATPSPPDTPWQHELEEAFPYERDARPAHGHRRGQGRHGAPSARWTAWSAATSGFGKTEVAHAGRVQGGPGRQAGGGAGAHHAAGPAALPDLLRALRRLPGPGRGAEPVPHPGPGPQGGRRAGRRRRSTSSSAPTGCWRTTSRFKDLGLLVVDEEQRFGVSHKEAIKQLRADVDVLTLTATPDPAHAGDEPHRHPRPDAAQHAAGRPPADPHLRRRVRRAGRGRGDPARAAARGPGLLRAQPGAGHREGGRRASASLVPEARVAVAHGQMDEGTLEQVVLDFWEGEYDVLVCTTIIESGIDMPTVNTLVVDRADLLGLGQLHQLRGRVGRAGQRAYAYLFFPPDRALTEEAYERLQDDRRAHRARARASRSPCATSRSAAPATCSAPTSAATSPRSATTSTADGHRGGRRAEGRGGPRRRPRSSSSCPLDANLPADYVSQRGPAPRGLPPPGRGHHRGRGRRHRAPSGSTATARCPPPAEALLRRGPAAGRVRPARDPRGGASARRRGPHRARSRLEDQPARAAGAAVPEGRLQGGHRPAGDPAGRRARRPRSTRPSCWSPSLQELVPAGAAPCARRAVNGPWRARSGTLLAP